MSILDMEIAKLDAANEAEREHHRAERRLWNTDALPASWDRGRKNRHVERQVMLAHAKNIALPAGRISEREYGLLEADMMQQEMSDMSMEEHLQATNRARAPNGAIVNVGGDAPCLLDQVRARAGLEAGDDRLADARATREARAKVIQSTGYELQQKGVIDEAGYGRLLRESDAVGAEMIDPRDKSVLLSDEDLGFGYWAHHFAPEVKPHEIWQEQQKEAEQKRVEADPRLKYKAAAEAEMKMDPAFVKDFESRNNPNPGTPRRAQLERLAERERLAAAKEAARDMAQGRAPSLEVQQTLSQVLDSALGNAQGGQD